MADRQRSTQQVSGSLAYHTSTLYKYGKSISNKVILALYWFGWCSCTTFLHPPPVCLQTAPLTQNLRKLHLYTS